MSSSEYGGILHEPLVWPPALEARAERNSARFAVTMLNQAVLACKFVDDPYLDKLVRGALAEAESILRTRQERVDAFDAATPEQGSGDAAP